MGDWDFLYEMRERGYSAEDIADAAGSGAAPWEWAYLDSKWLDSELDEGLENDGARFDASESFQGREGFSFSLIEQMHVFEDLVDCARRHFENTGRYLQIWGELGEIFAEIKFGLRRHAARSPGSDGTIDGKLVEVKTISPEKVGDRVVVKSKGDFEQLLIVRINSDFQFYGKLFERSALNGGAGKFLRGRLAGDRSSDDTG